MAIPLHILINSFATRSFRDVADQDYVAARLSFRSTLIPQFHWSGLQAIEKYLKCVLVLNRVKAPRGHDLAELLRILSESGKLNLELSEQTREFIVYLDTYGRHRYFESSWSVHGHELILLDWAVWEVRRYAKVLVPHAVTDASDRAARLRAELEEISRAGTKHPHQHAIPGGLLEDVLANPKHAARSALVWQNPCFGRSLRKRVKYWPGFRAANSPLTLNPHILDEVLKYVWLPKDMKDAYRSHRSAA